MKILRIALAVILYLNIVGCATLKVKVEGPTIKEIHETYIGKHYSEVVREWGNFDCEKNDDKGGKILTWVDKSQPVYYTTFAVNSKGIIYNWQSNKRTQADINIKKNKELTIALVSAVIIISVGLYLAIKNSMKGPDIPSIGDEWF